MDAVPSKPSGLPRPPSKLPSKLPALRPPTTTSTTSTTTPATTATTRTPSLAPPPKLTKRPPSASRTRPTQPVVKSSATAAPTSSKPGTARATSLSRLSKPVPKPPVGSRINPRVAPPKRSTTSSQASSYASADDAENHDQLSSLDSFRSASRQGSLDDPEPEPLDYVEPNAVTRSTLRKSSRPSLTERTIESLQSLPATPRERRRSSFFNPPQSPMAPPPRPGSSLSKNGSNGSRPGTSDGSFSRPASRPASPAKKAPSSAKSALRVPGKSSIGSINGTRRSVSGSLTSKLQDVRNASERAASPSKPASRGATNGTAPASKSIIGSKTIASSRPAKPRPALGEAFAPIQKQAAPATASAPPADGKRTVSNSSAALRQQIAAAKAAARKEKERASAAAVKHDSPTDLSSSGDPPFELEMSADPFNQAPKDDKHVLRNRINNARMDGRLNIAAMGLKEMPEQVLKMYTSAAMEEAKVNWAEVVDLSKLIAADNEFETIDDSVFVDRSAEDLSNDDQTEGNQFGGLELLDFHGNSLQSLPVGLRRLERLTSLNVARNKLDNAALDVIAQIPTLKELKLGHNNLTGNLPSSICDLRNLETLDLQANRLLGLPEALRELASLRILNVSGNQLTALPMDALEYLPLTDLDASNNALIASLFPLGGPDGHRTLQSLNASNNSLAALTFSETLSMPQLRELNLTNNHMTALPSVEGWTELITLLVGDNKLVDFPLGFTSLQKLRNVNVTSNEIRILDPMICKMERLESLILASNPLREKKFLTMTNASDIKRDLRSRLEPEDLGGDEDVPESPVTVIGGERRSSASMWSLKPAGLLDLASKNLSDSLNGSLSSFLHSNEVKQMQLQNNKITCIPPSLSLAQDLKVIDLSGNDMSIDYLSDKLLLPSLQELNMSRCRITSLDPLRQQLEAPNLRSLTVTANRLSGELPVLRSTYPRLTVLFANDNKIHSISVEALRGLQTVNLSSNDIEGLPSEIGLLWDEGLRSLEVGSNAFRVPGYRVLDKGTESTLRWLRDRIPVGAVEGSMSELD